MPANRKELSLKALELFQVCARKRSLQAAAEESGLTLSTVSHHLRGLETTLGVALFDHNRRPMVLTPKGQAFLSSIQDPLLALRKAQAEARAGDASGTGDLRIGTIEDFDDVILPKLAVHLSGALPGWRFTYESAPSHAVLDMLRNRDLDMGVAASPPDRHADIHERPLLRDPFVVVLPNGQEDALAKVLAGDSPLPFLRFSRSQLMARQIEAQLQRLGGTFPARFECSTNETLMAMVAAGAGWTITTPLLYARARRHQAALSMQPFPGKSFARTLSLLVTPDCSDTLRDMTETCLRELVQETAIAPVLSKAPWLDGRFRLMNG